MSDCDQPAERAQVVSPGREPWVLPTRDQRSPRSGAKARRGGRSLLSPLRGSEILRWTIAQGLTPLANHFRSLRELRLLGSRTTTGLAKVPGILVIAAVWGLTSIAGTSDVVAEDFAKNVNLEQF